MIMIPMRDYDCEALNSGMYKIVFIALMHSNHISKLKYGIIRPHNFITTPLRTDTIAVQNHPDPSQIRLSVLPRTNLLPLLRARHSKR